jgi:Na+/proline symporter
VAQVSCFVQVILGVILYSNASRKPSQFHMFYGFLTIIAVAILFAYREQLRPHLYLLYGFGGLFIMGLGLRAVFIRAY